MPNECGWSWIMVLPFLPNHIQLLVNASELRGTAGRFHWGLELIVGTGRLIRLDWNFLQK